MNALNIPDAAPLSPPSRLALLREARVVGDLLALGPRLLGSVPRTRRPQTVVALPGFGADDRSTWPLRRMLARAGHRAEAWGLGRNLAGLDIRHRFEDLSNGWQSLQAPPSRYAREGGVAMLCDRMIDTLRSRHPAGPPVVLVGWSLGGVIAREVAREMPERVALVVTLGSPVVGGPKYTAAARALRRRGLDLDWIERGVALREATPIEVPVVSVVSPSDAIVARSAAYDRHSRQVRHVEVDAAHLSLCFRPEVWRIVLEAIEQGG